MATRSIIRYAAKLGYQLGLMRGIYQNIQLGMTVTYDYPNMIVVDNEGCEHHVPIAKSWCEL